MDESDIHKAENLPAWVRVSPLFARVRDVQKAGRVFTPSACRLEIAGHLWHPFEHAPDSCGKLKSEHDSFAYIRRCSADTRG